MRSRFVDLLVPWLGSLAHLIVPGYVFMLVLGALAGVVLAVDRGQREGFAKTDIITTSMIAYAGGLAGACAVPAMQAFAAWASGDRFAAPTGMAAYGGLIGGVVAGVAYLKKRELDVWRFLDVAAPTLAIGIFFARIGCFLAGCDYGAPTTSRVGVAFPAYSHAFRDHLARGWIDASATASLPVHPTQLYEAAAGLGLFFVVRAMRARPSARFVTLVLGYAFLRSLIELVRGDASRGHIGVLSTSQVLALVTVIAVVLLAPRAKASVA